MTLLDEWVTCGNTNHRLPTHTKTSPCSFILSAVFDLPKRQHNSAIEDDNMGCVTNDEERLWSHTEALMQKTENSTSEKLENDGIVAEGDNDPNSEEGKLWRVIEGSTVPLSDVA